MLLDDAIVFVQIPHCRSLPLPLLGLPQRASAASAAGSKSAGVNRTDHMTAAERTNHASRHSTELLRLRHRLLLSSMQLLSAHTNGKQDPIQVSCCLLPLSH
jgi:hypothetical protein